MRTLLFILRWSLLILSVLILITAAASFRWGFTFYAWSEHGAKPVGTAATRGVEVARGGVKLWNNVFLRTQLFGTEEVHRRVTRNPSYAGANEARWGYALHFRRTDKSRIFTLVVPLYLPFALAALTTLLLFRAHRRKVARERRGLCPACGYDLRATSDRCPECGAAPNRKPGSDRLMV